MNDDHDDIRQPHNNDDTNCDSLDPGRRADRPEDTWLRNLKSWHIGLFVVAVWLTASVVILFIENVEITGLFGDSFGSVNALFSGLAFGGVIYTLILQREALAQQQEELRLTRDEHERARKQHQRSAKALEDTYIESVRSRSADVFLRLSDDLVETRQYWHELYQLPPYETGWSKQQEEIADRVCTALQRVAFVIESGFIDGKYIMEEYAGTFEKCWAILQPYIQDYRIKSGEDPTSGKPAFQRRHFESFAKKCGEHFRENYS